MTETLPTHRTVKMIVLDQLMDIIVQLAQDLHHLYAHNLVETGSKLIQNNVMMAQIMAKDA